MIRSLTESNIWIQIMVQQKSQKTSDESKSIDFILVPTQRNVFRGCEIQHVQRSQIWSGAAIGIGAIFQKNTDTIEVANFHGVSEMMKVISID